MYVYADCVFSDFPSLAPIICSHLCHWDSWDRRSVARRRGKLALLLMLHPFKHSVCGSTSLNRLINRIRIQILIQIGFVQDSCKMLRTHERQRYIGYGNYREMIPCFLRIYGKCRAVYMSYIYNTSTTYIQLTHTHMHQLIACPRQWNFTITLWPSVRFVLFLDANGFPFDIHLAIYRSLFRSVALSPLGFSKFKTFQRISIKNTFFLSFALVFGCAHSFTSLSASAFRTQLRSVLFINAHTDTALTHTLARTLARPLVFSLFRLVIYFFFNFCH